MKEVIVQDFTEPMKMLKECGVWCIQIDVQVTAMAVQLNSDKETVKRPELWSSDWILHHDNAPAHKALSVKQFLAQKSITEMEHQANSPDLTSNDFCLFPKIKFDLKGRIFQDTEDIHKNVTTVLKAIPQEEIKNTSNSSNIIGLSA
jgi:hypothetical protein